MLDTLLLRHFNVLDFVMDSPLQSNSSLEQNFDKINSNSNTHCSPVQASLSSSSSSVKTQHIHPRKYQLEVFEVARQKNKIAVLGTGSGKTLIAVMLLNDIGQSIKSSGLKKSIIFLAPTVHLVNQRLEFLGDSVLDLLITWHLYQSHTDIDPGELTDLRSASVNNENFAQAAVRQNLQQYLLHSSGLLLGQINDYVKDLSELNSTESLPGLKGPKVLGDLIESIAGAILIDTKLNLDEVWKVFKPLLSPIVTPDKLELPPLRELLELSGSLGYFVKEKCKVKGDTVHAELSFQLQDVLLVGEGRGRNRKTAKGEAAFHLLKDLEKKGISHNNSGTKRKRDNLDHSFDPSTRKEINIGSGVPDEHVSEPVTNKRAKVDKTNLSSPKDVSMELSDPNDAIPVIASINMKKGGPRITLFDLCKRLQWPMPTFDSTEQKQRTLFEFGEGKERRKGYICFMSSIQLCIPNYGNINCKGDSRADKKSSLDSAALEMLYELQRLGRLKIGDC